LPFKLGFAICGFKVFCFVPVKEAFQSCFHGYLRSVLYQLLRLSNIGKRNFNFYKTKKITKNKLLQGIVLYILCCLFPCPSPEGEGGRE